MNKSIFSINSLSKYSHLFQIVGVIGLIASLIFVGLELRQTQKIALNTQNQARTETLIRTAEFLFDNDLPINEWLTHGVKEKDRNVISTFKHMAW